MKKILFVFLIILLVSSAVFSEENRNKPAFLAKPMVTSDIWIDANRMNGVYRNNGTWLYDNVAGNWGLEWPKGSGLSPVFAGGQWVGAVVDGDIRVAGVQHSATEFQPGMILEPFSADNPRAGEYQWYAIQPGGQGDWTNWPFTQGAPYVDDNGNGMYDAGEQPQLIGDITAFSVWNDLAAHTEYNTNKLSVEVGQTVFAFNRADALGDMQFVKWRLVNKSGVDWDSTYFSIWLDPDVGGATDDLVGCDPMLGLGYCYNGAATDQSYGSTPPAVGIDFFQGPIIDNPDSTVFLPDGTVLEGKEMLKMTSFVFYNNNDNNVNGNPQSGKDVWNFMRSIWRNDQPVTQGGRGTDSNAPRAYFMFDGDPEAGTGWLDSEPDDRRFLMTTGPFPMKAWEDVNGNGMPELGEPGVQDIVASIMVARGASNLKSVTKLKTVDELAQLAYDLNFKLSNAPSPPSLSSNARSNEVILKWDDSSEFNKDGSPYSSADPIVGQAYGDTVIIDNVVQVINDSTYNFYGYTVYQYSDASGRNPVQLEHWDNGGTADAEPYGGNRYSRILVNKNPEVGPVGVPLINGKEYYFGVVAEGYLGFGSPEVLQSAPTIVTVVPQNLPGAVVDNAYTYGDTIMAEYAQVDTNLPSSVGQVYAIVVDNSQTTGHQYRVTFNEDGTWNLFDVDESDTLLSHKTNQTGNGAYFVVDGLMVKVEGPALGTRQVYEDSAGVTIDDGVSIIELSLGSTGYIVSNMASDASGSIIYNDVGNYVSDFDRFDYWGTDDIVYDFSDSSVAWDYLYEYVLDEKVPFALYRRHFPSGEMERLYVAIYDNGYGDTTAAMGLGVWDTTGLDGLFGKPKYEPIFGYVSSSGPYDPEFEQAYIDSNNMSSPPSTTGWGASGNPLVYPFVTSTIFVDYLGGGLPIGNQVIFETYKPNSTNDIFTFTAPAAQEISDTKLKQDMDNIKVVPNPYYGYHPGEMNPFDRWVQFTYIPANKEVTIRIFDLAGNVVWKETKNDDRTLVQWDMHNEYDLPVASGVYVYQVEVKGVGEKIGKLAIFAPQERLDTY
jgi:hypothetical protein